jgi:hypothetical protein
VTSSASHRSDPLVGWMFLVDVEGVVRVVAVLDLGEPVVATRVTFSGDLAPKLLDYPRITIAIPEIRYI